MLDHIIANRIDSNQSFNATASTNPVEIALDKYCNTLKRQKTGIYTEDFLNSIINFAKSKIDIENCNNPETALEKFKKIIDELLKPTDVSKKDISLKSLNKYANSKKIQEQYLASIFLNKFKELELTDAEIEAFLDRIIRRVHNKNFDDKKLNNSIDTNKNKNWLEELLEIANQEFSQIKKVDRNASTIDTNIFFKNKQEYTASDLCYGINNLYLSDDGGVRKFAELLQRAFDNLGAKGQEDQIEVINWVIKYINQSVGIQNTDPVVLTKNAIEKLNNQNIFDQLLKIVDSKELYYDYLLDDVDGDIEPFQQGHTGDCWLLSSIIALNNSELGQQIIKDSIHWNNDNRSVTVTFRGLGVSYVISTEEIVEAIEARTAYSKGDHDVLILEIATEKLRRDIAAGKIKVPQEGYYYNYTNKNDTGENGSGITGGHTEQMLYYLTGNTSKGIFSGNATKHLSKDKIKNYCLGLYNDFKNGNVALTFTIHKNIHSFTTIDGETISIDLGESGHTLTIVAMTQDTVTIVNPWNSNKEFTMTWDEFAKFGIYKITSTNITQKKNKFTFDEKEYDINKVLKSNTQTFVSVGKKVKGFSNAVNKALNNIRNILISIKYALPNYDLSKLENACETTYNYYQAALSVAANNIIDNNGAIGKPFTYYNASTGKNETSNDKSNMRSAWNSNDVNSPEEIAEKSNVPGTGIFIGHDKQSGHGHLNDNFYISIDLKTVINKFKSFI